MNQNKEGNMFNTKSRNKGMIQLRTEDGNSSLRRRLNMNSSNLEHFSLRSLSKKDKHSITKDEESDVPNLKNGILPSYCTSNKDIERKNIQKKNSNTFINITIGEFESKKTQKNKELTSIDSEIKDALAELKNLVDDACSDPKHLQISEVQRLNKSRSGTNLSIKNK